MTIANDGTTDNLKFTVYNGASKSELAVENFWSSCVGGWCHVAFTVDDTGKMTVRRRQNARSGNTTHNNVPPFPS